MVLGIGVDMVMISEMERILGEGGLASAFVRHTFAPAELAQAEERARLPEYLSGRFAVKEAVFKAIASLTRGSFDLRIVECLDDENGAPKVSLAGPLAPILAEAGVSSLLVSITNEGGYVLAFAVAEG